MRASTPELGAQPMFRPAFFISGGNTGADSIPFTVYERLGVGLRGYLPEGLHRADGCGEAVARRHGLWEGQGSHKWRDMANAGLSDALVAFLSSAPMTGRGTMSTVNVFVNGRHHFVALQQPEDGCDFLLLEPEEQRSAGSTACGQTTGGDRVAHVGVPDNRDAMDFKYSHAHPKHPIAWDPAAKRNAFTKRPVLVFWDLREDRLQEHAAVLGAFLRRHRPENLMFSGPLESTYPGIEELGAALLLRAFGEELQHEGAVTHRRRKSPSGVGEGSSSSRANVA